MEISSVLLIVAGFILLMMALGLARILRGPGDADRILSLQLIGSGGVAALLLASVAIKSPPIMDVALMLGLLATFVSVAYLRGAADSTPASAGTAEDR